MHKSSSELLEDLLDFAFTFGFADYNGRRKSCPKKNYNQSFFISCVRMVLSLKLMLSMMMASKMKTTPNHWVELMISPSMMKEITMETGSSKAERMLPKPTPTIGNPLLNMSGGMTVPNKAIGIPH